MAVLSTRLRFVSGADPSVLDAIINNLGFKVEIKSIAFAKTEWFIWFVLPDNIEDERLAERVNRLKSGSVDASN